MGSKTPNIPLKNAASHYFFGLTEGLKPGFNPPFFFVVGAPFAGLREECLELFFEAVFPGEFGEDCLDKEVERDLPTEVGGPRSTLGVLFEGEGGREEGRGEEDGERGGKEGAEGAASISSSPVLRGAYLFWTGTTGLSINGVGVDFCFFSGARVVFGLSFAF